MDFCLEWLLHIREDLGGFRSQTAAFKSASFTLKQPFHYVLGVLPQKGVEETQLICMTSGIGLKDLQQQELP